MRSDEPGQSGYRAKTAYQDEDEVRTYDDARFRSARGRFVDLLEKKAILRALSSVPEEGRVLDIPCGTGRITELLLERGHAVVAADISSEMLEAARSKLAGFANLECLDLADAERLQYEDHEFDAVTSIRLMNHVPPETRIAMLREMARVSRGAVIVSHCNPNSLSGLKRRVKYTFKPPHAPWNPATRRQVRIEAEQAGLTVAAVFPILGPISETNVYLLLPRKDVTGG